MRNRTYTRILRTLLVLALASFFGCDTDADSEDTETDTDTGTDTDTDTDTDTGTNDDSGDGAFTVTGNYNGTPLDYVCNFDETDGDYQASLQCQTLQFFVTCRPFPWNEVPGVDTMQLWFYLPTATTVGTHDYTEPYEGGIQWGDGMSTPLLPSEENRVTNQIIVEAIDPEVSAKGSYSAEWTDEGGNYGIVSGTFDMVCQ